MKQFYIVLLLFCFSQSFSQGNNRFFEISLGTGVDIISFRDISSSPLAYSGFGLPLALRAKLRRDKGIHQLDIHAISRLLTNNYALSSASGSSLDTWEKVSLRYSYLRDVSDDSDYVGGSFQSFIFYREYDFFDGQSYEFMAHWNVDYQKLIRISDRFALAAQISLPLVAYIHRKPSLTLEEEFLDDFFHGGGLYKYGRWKTNFSDWFGLHGRLQGDLKLSSRWSLTASIEMQYYTISFPERVSNVNYPVICYVNYRF